MKNLKNSLTWILPLLLIVVSCASQNNINKSENNMAERLDIKRLERKAEKTVYDNGVVSYYWEYKEKG